MQYDFWDYFWGAIILSMFLLPIIALVVFKLGIMIVMWIGSMSGSSYEVAERGSTVVRFNSNDYDEDEY